MNEKKIIIGVILASVVILVGAIFLLGGSSSGKANLEKTVGAKLETPETNFDFKDISYSGGVVTHAYKVKNTGDKDLKIANMATSCMCTQVYLKQGQTEGFKFGMKGMSPASDWTGIIKPGEEGEIVAAFDPAYHGPQGVGPIQRLVSFETNDPDHPYVELNFSGNVVKN